MSTKRSLDAITVEFYNNFREYLMPLTFKLLNEIEKEATHSNLFIEASIILSFICIIHDKSYIELE